MQRRATGRVSGKKVAEVETGGSERRQGAAATLTLPRLALIRSRSDVYAAAAGP